MNIEEIYINVEICTSAEPVSYLYKYIYKGSDSANVSTTVATAPAPDSAPRVRRNGVK